MNYNEILGKISTSTEDIRVLCVNTAKSAYKKLTETIHNLRRNDGNNQEQKTDDSNHHGNNQEQKTDDSNHHGNNQQQKTDDSNQFDSITDKCFEYDPDTVAVETSQVKVIFDY